MESALMEQVFRIGDTEPYEILPSGHKAWLLAKVGNLSATIMETEKETEIPSPCHKEEEFVYVLDGWLAYDGGREARSGEAVYNPPDIPHPGKYLGKLLSIKVYPESNMLPPDKVLMNEVIRIEDVESFYEEKVMTTRRLWIATENFSIVMNESNPGDAFKGTVHPEKEIVYVIQGQIEYDNKRVVRAGEAIINLSDMLHPGRRGGTEHICSFETKVPADPKLLARFRERVVK
jgi:quercetin dioxygenase-like cupin family protein